MFPTRRTRIFRHIFTGCSASSEIFLLLILTVRSLFRPNIALSALSPSPIPLGTTHTRYIPPHPQRGSPYHRYVLLLLPQPSSTERISIPVPLDTERLGFNVREFTETYGLDASKGGGAHMWREVWNEHVSDIYRDVLSACPSFMQESELTCTFFRNGRTEICPPAQT